MSRDWEQTFRNWGGPPSQTEQDKCDNAERAIRKAISASEKLNNLDIKIFPKGSYYNRTNARLSSDVDICILCSKTIYFGPQGVTLADIGLQPITYHYAEYKNDIHATLVNYFGSAAVTRGNKAFAIHANTYRVDSDAVACFLYRFYFKNNHGLIIPSNYIEGEWLCSDNGEPIVNWSKQNYDNGVKKNKATGRRFKAVVRILKHLRNEMAQKVYQADTFLPSFPIECLVWNVPNEGFGYNNYTDDVKWVLAYLWDNTREDSSCTKWREVNEIKYLFRSSHPWTREQANNFFLAAWNYIGF